MEDKDMASERTVSGQSAGTTGQLMMLSGGVDQYSGNKLHLHVGKKTGSDSVSHSNEDLNQSNSSDLPNTSNLLTDSRQCLTIESALEALAEPDASITTNGGSSSDTHHQGCEVDVASCHDHSSILTPMPNIDDSGFLLEPGDKLADDSGRISSNDDISFGDYCRTEGQGRPLSTTSDLSSPPFSSNTLSDPSEDKDLRGNNGHLSDSGSRFADGSVSGQSTTSLSKPTTKGSDKKKKGSYWYNSEAWSSPALSGRSLTNRQFYIKVLSPTYKSRSEDFKKIFKDIPRDERLMVDYSCALQKDILVHGRLYITQNWICFYANIFRWETVLTIRCSGITSMTKEKTARVIPNAIQICTEGEKYFFTSFGARDKTYLMLFRVWQNALMDQPMSPQELWQWVHYSYGDDLGLTSSDDDYIAPTQDDEEKFQKILTQDEMNESQEKDVGEESEVVLNTGENGHVLPIPSPVATTKMSSPSTSDNVSVLTNSTNEDVREADTKPGRTNLEVPPPTVASPELPTDTGDTTEEEEEEEVTCENHDHPGFVTLDEVFDLSCDQIFELLFTESTFYKDFVTARKTYDLVLSPWPVEPDFQERKTRMITYTLSLNYSIGPKCSPSTEKQTLYGESKPGSIYVIDCEVVNGGIPYGDNFYVVNRYCITRVTSRKSRLHVTSDLRYKKNVWGIVKNLIEKNAHTGLNENFSLLASHLRAENEKRQLLSASSSKSSAVPPHRKKYLRRRRPHASTDRSPSTKRPTETLPPQGTPIKGRTSDEWQLQFDADTVVRVVCTVLLLLVIFNAILFYKLWSLEVRAASPRFDRQSLLHDLGSQTRSQDEWLALLEQQQELHEMELERWKDILSSSVHLMEQMKNVLEGLQSSIEKRSRFTFEAPSPPRA